MAFASCGRCTALLPDFRILLSSCRTSSDSWNSRHIKGIVDLSSRTDSARIISVTSMFPLISVKILPFSTAWIRLRLASVLRTTSIILAETGGIPQRRRACPKLGSSFGAKFFPMVIFSALVGEKHVSTGLFIHDAASPAFSTFLPSPYFRLSIRNRRNQIF